MVNAIPRTGNEKAQTEVRRAVRFSLALVQGSKPTLFITRAATQRTLIPFLAIG